MMGSHFAHLRFPDIGNTVDDLFCRDGNFRDMCEELAELESAIGSSHNLPWAHRADLLADWHAARERLLLEMANALAQANVIPMGRGHHGPRH